MSEIKVTVIMPVYNVEKYIDEALCSVCNQTLKEIEIICVDDGSTDSTRELLKNWEGKDNRIKTVFQNNQYAGVARNNGLKHASGKYVVFWDGDDIFHPKALELMYLQCEKEQADLCVCAANKLDNSDGKKIYTNVYLRREWMPNKKNISKETNSKYIFNFSSNVPWNKMWKRSFILENHLSFKPIKQTNDVYFSMMSYFYAKKITVLKKRLIDYRINNSNSLTGKASDTYFCAYETYLDAFHDLKNHPDFTGDVKTSFQNKVITGMVVELKNQTNVHSFIKLYERIQKMLAKDFEINFDQFEYYVKSEKELIQNVLSLEANQFLLMNWSNSTRQNRNQLKKPIYQIYYSMYYTEFYQFFNFLKKLLIKS